MLVKICTKNEPLEPCDVLIAKESAQLQAAAKDLEALFGDPPRVYIVKEKENMMLKAGVLLSRIIAGIDSYDAKDPISVSCSDKPVLEAVCSLDYELASGDEVKCVPAGTKPAPAPRVRNKAKPPAKQEAPAGKDGDDGHAARQAQGGTAAGDAPAPQAGAGSSAAPASGADEMAGLMEDPAFTSGDEVSLQGGAPEAPKLKPGEAPAARIMKMLKDAGIPSGQVPGVLDAIRESIDPSITLPMQIRLRVMKDGAGDEMAVEETAKRVEPLFADIKKLMKEAQEA